MSVSFHLRLIDRVSGEIGFLSIQYMTSNLLITLLSVSTIVLFQTYSLPWLQCSLSHNYFSENALSRHEQA